jgi:hypothetical protein
VVVEESAKIVEVHPVSIATGATDLDHLVIAAQ